MINNFILGIKLLKYTFNFKQNVFLMVIFIFVGIIWLFMPSSSMAQFGPVYLSITGLYLLQMLGSLQFSGMVLSSPKKKRLQTFMPATLSLPCSLIFYALTVLAVVYNKQFTVLIAYGALSMLMMVYEVLWPKLGTAVVIMYTSMMVGIILGFPYLDSTILEGISLGAAIVIGLAEILLGIFLQYQAAQLTYRLPVKSATMLAAIQKYR